MTKIENAFNTKCGWEQETCSHGKSVISETTLKALAISYKIKYATPFTRQCQSRSLPKQIEKCSSKDVNMNVCHSFNHKIQKLYLKETGLGVPQHKNG